MPEGQPAPSPAPPELDFEEFQRVVGPIRALSPAQAGQLFDGAPFTSWVAGGWSTELTPEPRRFHEDLEICVPRHDLDALRNWLRDFHLWDTHEGCLRHLRPDAVVPDDHEQLWLRRDGYSPWLLDLMLTPVEGDVWFYKRDHRVFRALGDATRIGHHGIPYQRPEISLLFKARRRFVKDELDFEAVIPTLDSAERSWLREAIELTEPADNPWLDHLNSRDA